MNILNCVFISLDYFKHQSKENHNKIKKIQKIKIKIGVKMNQVKVCFSKEVGKIKPLNAVNNGPIVSVRSIGTENIFTELNIPFARLHDASFCSAYGGEFTVDVHRIFRNFDADENLEENYIFEATDKYLKNIQKVGTKIFYRLGASIEHGVKFGTFPPKDFLKWAKICEHIIRHYNEKWANGYEMGIEYWEIWNEPDCRNADGSNPCWQGTEEQFIELYSVSAKYLKQTFPNLKIGGPAFASVWSEAFVNKFLKSISENQIPLDFFSYHWYGKKVSDFAETICKAQTMLEEYGLGKTEKILNEWNYVDGWLGDDFLNSILAIKGQKGASFVCAAICEAQKLDLDMLMYYDARPCAFCGLFETDTYQKLNTFNAFSYFNQLLKRGTAVETQVVGQGVYACSAKSNESASLMFTYFPEDNKESAEINLTFTDLPSNFTRAKVFIANSNQEGSLVSEIEINNKESSINVNLNKYDIGYVCLCEK